MNYGLWASRTRLPTWGRGQAPAHPEPETPARRLQPGERKDVAASPQGCAHVVCRGGRSALLAADRRARLPAWRTGPEPAHLELETPARRLPLGDLQDVAASPWRLRERCVPRRSWYTTGRGPSADLEDKKTSPKPGLTLSGITLTVCFVKFESCLRVYEWF